MNEDQYGDLKMSEIVPYEDYVEIINGEIMQDAECAMELLKQEAILQEAWEDSMIQLTDEEWEDLEADVDEGDEDDGEEDEEDD